MMAGVCWAWAVTLPHRGAISALCTLGWRFCHCNQMEEADGDWAEYKIHYTYFYPSAERFADISWRFYPLVHGKSSLVW